MRDNPNAVALSDTSQKAQTVYLERLREMTPCERLAIGVALWVAADSIQRAVVRRENPHADEAEIAFQLAVARFGVELAGKAYRNNINVSGGSV